LRILITNFLPNIHHDMSKFHKYWKLWITCIHPLTHWEWISAPISDIEKFKYLSFKERQPCQSDNGYIVYKSKNILSSFKFYIPFVLVATKCNIVDYWLKKHERKVQIFVSITNATIKISHKGHQCQQRIRINRILIMNIGKNHE
jgi:hypothetical protein